MSVIDRIPAGAFGEKPWEKIPESELGKQPDQLNPFQVAIKLQEIVHLFADKDVEGELYTEPVDLVIDDKRLDYQVCAGLSRQVGMVVFLVDKSEGTASLWFSVDNAKAFSFVDGKGDGIEDQEGLMTISSVLDNLRKELDERVMERVDKLDVADIVEDYLETEIKSATRGLQTLESKAADLVENELNLNNFRVKIIGTTTEDRVDEVIPTQSLSDAIAIATKLYKAIERHSGSTAKCSVDIDLGDGVLVPVQDETVQKAFNSLVRI